MDEQRRSRSHSDPSADPAEGVRIIGPDEAAEAMERPDVAARRTNDEPRFGDRPASPPAGPRPALRFPLDASADPTRIERPPVAPAPDPVTGPVELPHWTEPPTGEVPAVLIGDDGPLLGEDGDDLDAWSSFATSTPRWRDADDDWADDGFVESLAADEEVRVGVLGDQDNAPSHEEYFGFEDLDERVEERTGEASEARWEDEDEAEVDPSGYDGDDWSASAEGFDDDDDVEDAIVEEGAVEEEWSDDDDEDDFDDRQQAGPNARPAMSARVDDGFGGPPAKGPDRDMPTAIAVACGLAGLFLISLAVGTWMTVGLIAVVLALAAGEFFAVLRRVGWEAAPLLGIAASALFPLALYWRGPGYFGLVIFLALAAVLAWFLVGAGGPDPRLLEGAGATMLGIVWIGGLGSFAAAMLTAPDGKGWLIVAVLGAAAYDIGGLFLGRSIGHRPLSAASPNKTVEGLVAGMACTWVVVLVAVGIFDLGPWTGTMAGLSLGLGAAVAAPLGDLCQSLLKRDLGVKDMGSLLPGHGGILDRFDSLLFVLPAIYWLTLTLGS